jgi:hypothetical protein
MLLLNQTSVDMIQPRLSLSGHLPRDDSNLASLTPTREIDQTLSLHHMPFLLKKAVFSDA